MDAHHRVGIGRRQRQRRDCRRITPVAQRHADVAQHPAAFGALDRRTGKVLTERGLVEPVRMRRVETFQQRRRKTGALGVQRVESGRARGQAPVVRADLLADVAAKDVVAKARAQFTRDDAARLDCPVSDAALRVEVVGADKRRRRAGVQTARAAATGEGGARGEGRGAEGQLRMVNCEL